MSRASVFALTIALATSVVARAEDATLPNHELAERHEALQDSWERALGRGGETQPLQQRRYYVPPELRLKTQIDNMLATLDANATTLQNAAS